MYSTKPTNYIESVTKNGFHLSNNLLIESKLNKIPQIGTSMLLPPLVLVKMIVLLD